MNINLVREQLKKKKLTQKDLAKMASISKAQVSNILVGRSKPKIETVEKIAAALGLQISLLLAPGPINVQNGHINIAGNSKGEIKHLSGNSNIYTTTGEIESMRKEIESLKELVKSKEETIASLKMTIDAIRGN